MNRTILLAVLLAITLSQDNPEPLEIQEHTDTPIQTVPDTPPPTLTKAQQKEKEKWDKKNAALTKEYDRYMGYIAKLDKEYERIQKRKERNKHKTTT
jgi:molecular chaperone GrpE (heat shock protein)